MARYRISELAGRTGTRPTTLRFYDQAGLLPAERSRAGYRIYGEDAVERLGVIASGKYLGLPLEQIRDLLDAWQDGQCADVRRRLRPMLVSRIGEAERRVAALSAAAGRLRQALAEVDGAPPHAGRCEPGCGCVHHGDGRDVPVSAAMSPLGQAAPGQAPVSCTLNDTDRAGRARQWHRLLAHAQGREPIRGGLRIRLPAALAGPAAELAAAEQRCCAFFDFTLQLTGAGLALEVRAPEEAAAVVAGLFGTGADRTPSPPQ